MSDLKVNRQSSGIAYSCYVTRSREGEQFAAEHVLSYQISGTLTANNGDKEYVFNEGDFRFVRRNQLIKFVKQPRPGGTFSALSIYLDQATLRSFSMEYDYESEIGMARKTEGVMHLKSRPLLKSFMDSLLPYAEGDQLINEQLQTLKLREAILILLQSHPAMKGILFDFGAPGKIDMEAFMNRNFQFNVNLTRYAYLTGRSLATFKRDFESIFNTSPSRWLLHRRLQEAHYLIKEKGLAPSEVYLEIGFEDLSHFSHAFKKAYGIPPSRFAK